MVFALTVAGHRSHDFSLHRYGISEGPCKVGVDTSISGQIPDLEGRGLDTAHLVAHDIGGGFTHRIGVESTHRLRTLTLIDVVSFGSYPFEWTRGRDCCHFAPEERPAEVAAGITEFLDSHRS